MNSKVYEKNSKVYENAAAALFDLRDGMSLMSGGFGLCGIPENSIKEIRRQGIKRIHAISNNIGNSGRGLAWLLKEKQISAATCSYVGGNPDLEQQMLAGEIDVTLFPKALSASGSGLRAWGFGVFTHPPDTERSIADRQRRTGIRCARVS